MSAIGDVVVVVVDMISVVDNMKRDFGLRGLDRTSGVLLAPKQPRVSRSQA